MRFILCPLRLSILDFCLRENRYIERKTIKSTVSMHQTSDFNMRQNFLTQAIHRQLTANNWNPQKYISLCFGSNYFRISQIGGIASDISLWFKMNTITLRKVVSIHKKPSPSLDTPQITIQILVTFLKTVLEISS